MEIGGEMSRPLAARITLVICSTLYFGGFLGAIYLLVWGPR